MARVRVTNGPSRGQTVEFHDEVTIGREAGDLRLEDPEISRRHVALRSRGDGIEIEDLGSANGTFVDDERIGASTTVTGRARIRIGATVLELDAAPVAPTRRHLLADPQATRIAEARPPSAAEPALAPEVPPDFGRPEHPRRRGIASRSWVPVALSFGTAILSAIALVIYFAAR